jgi:hypothetical protein
MKDFLEARLLRREKSAVKVIFDVFERKNSLVFLGETHDANNLLYYRNWFRVLKGEGVDCVLLEIDADRVNRKAFADFNGRPDLGIRGKRWEDSVGKVRSLIQLGQMANAAKASGLKLFPIDKPGTRENLRQAGTVKGVQDRDDYMAREIKGLFDSATCFTALSINGEYHLHNAIFTEKRDPLPKMLLDRGFTLQASILVEPHAFAFNPERAPDPRNPDKLGSTYQKPGPCKYAFSAFKYSRQWGFGLGYLDFLPRVPFRTRDDAKVQWNHWSSFEATIKLQAVP